jgi:hypothetical protein
MAGLVVVVINYIQGDAVFATILLALLGLLLGLLLWWTWPGRGGAHISHAAAQAAASDGDVIVYWRPGCVFCDRLKLGLGSARHDVSWVNILKDSEAAEFVTICRDGNVIVPTAVTGAGVVIDATPAAIKAQLGAASSER